jgi:hypothetical protein
MMTGYRGKACLVLALIAIGLGVLGIANRTSPRDSDAGSPASPPGGLQAPESEGSSRLREDPEATERAVRSNRRPHSDGGLVSIRDSVTGHPIPEARVAYRSVAPETPEENAAHLLPLVARTDASGLAVLEDAGSYLLVVGAEGYSTTTGVFDLTGGRTAITLRPCASVVIAFRDSLGKPVAGIRVGLVEALEPVRSTGEWRSDLTGRASRELTSVTAIDRFLSTGTRGPDRSLEVWRQVVDTAPARVSDQGTVQVVHGWWAVSDSRGQVRFENLRGDETYRWGSPDFRRMSCLEPLAEARPKERLDSGDVLLRLDVPPDLSGPFLLAEGTSRHLDVTCRNTGAIRGVIADAPHAPDRRPYLRVLGISNEGTEEMPGPFILEIDAEQLASTDGSFRLEGVPAGDKLLRAMWWDEPGDRLNTGSRRFELEEGEDLDLGVFEALGPHEIAVEAALVDGRGRPVDGALFFVNPEELQLEVEVSSRGLERGDYDQSTLFATSITAGHEVRMAGFYEGEGSIRCRVRKGEWATIHAQTRVEIPSKAYLFSIPDDAKVLIPIKVQVTVPVEFLLTSSATGDGLEVSLMLIDEEGGGTQIVDLGRMEGGVSMRRNLDPGRYAILASTSQLQGDGPEGTGEYAVCGIDVTPDEVCRVQLEMSPAAAARVRLGAPDEDGRWRRVLEAVPADVEGEGGSRWKLTRAIVDQERSALLRGLVPHTRYAVRGGGSFTTGPSGSVVECTLD